jgi:hypothetical protein
MLQSIHDLFPSRVIIAEHPARFVPRTPCWLWLGALNYNGYGVPVVHERRRWIPHRLAFFLAHGVEPGRQFVCHTCDVPRCVNPDHLFLGDAKLNAMDKIKWETQLSLDDLNAIKDSKLPARLLADQYRLSMKQVDAIRPMRFYGAKFRGHRISEPYRRSKDYRRQ